jgi:hypothetical protein
MGARISEAPGERKTLATTKHVVGPWNDVADAAITQTSRPANSGRCYIPSIAVRLPFAAERSQAMILKNRVP